MDQRIEIVPIPKRLVEFSILCAWLTLALTCEKDDKRDGPCDPCQDSTCTADTTCNDTILPPPGILTFERTVGTPDVEQVLGADLTSDGGCIVTGYYRKTSLDGFWAFLIRTDAKGDTLWMRRYRAPNNIYGLYGMGESVQQTSDGGFIMGGVTQSDSNKTGDNDFYVVRTNAVGDTLWTRFYDRSVTDGINAIKQTSDGGFVCVGASGDLASVIRLTSSGDSLWIAPLEELNLAQDVVQTHDGNFMIVGYGPGGYIRLAKIDQNGSVLWYRTYGNPFGNEAFAIDKTTDGGYILAGGTISNVGELKDTYLVRITTDGDTLWTRTYPWDGADGARDVSALPDGGFIVSASYRIIRTNAFGDTLWTRPYGNAFGGAGLVFSKPTPDGGFIFVGVTGVNKGDVYLLKTDSLGLVH